MKLAVIYRPRNAPPPEAMPMMFQALEQWLKTYGERFETLHLFAGGGGMGVGDFDDSAEVQRMTAEHPFTVFADVEVKPAVEWETALRNLQEAMAQRE